MKKELIDTIMKEKSQGALGEYVKAQVIKEIERSSNEKVLDLLDGKKLSLEKVISQIYDEAKKRAVNNSAVLTNEETDGIIRQCLGVEERAAGVVSLFDVI